MLEFLDTDQLYTAEISLAWMSDEPFSELNPYFFISVKSPCILEASVLIPEYTAAYFYGQIFLFPLPLDSIWASDNYSSAFPTVKMCVCFAGGAYYLWRGEGRSHLGTTFATGKGNFGRISPVTKPMETYPPIVQRHIGAGRALSGLRCVTIHTSLLIWAIR